MDGRMDGWIDGEMERDGRMDRVTEGQMDA